jgi:phospholipid transport system substrate-binding protein
MFKKFLFSLTLATLLPMVVFAGSDDPKAVVETAVNGVIHVLKSRSDQSTITLADREAIRQSIKGYFDFREMAKRSLGRPWRNMDAAQRTNFVDTFRELLERSYGNRLSDYHDQTVEFGKVKTKGRIAIVNSEVIDTEKRTPVRYKLVHKKSGWRVYDIKVEGISMVSTFRSDFKHAVSQKGIDGFLDDLKKQVEKMKKQDQVQS